MVSKALRQVLLPAFILSATLTTPSFAMEGPNGPAATAVKHWFLTGKDTTCIDPNGNKRPCKITLDTQFHVFYDEANQTAIAFVTWLPDPTGNASAVEAAIFKREGTNWALNSRVPGLTGLLPGSVKFSEGRALFEMTVMKPGDSRCCPTGRKAHAVRL